jgi:hypothetical protein
MTNAQYDYVLSLARTRNINLNRCPTCRQERTEVAPGVWIWDDSTYRLYGKDHPCDCKWQDTLRRHYMLANIPMAYWSLGPDDWWGDPQALIAAQEYLYNWEDNKWVGLGIDFYSPRMGVGKTMLSTIIAKALINAGEKVYFTSFRDAVSALVNDLPDAADTMTRLRETPVLILDEVGAGWSENMRALYADKLEDLVRFRTSGCAVTIMTTNMTPDELNDEYSRCFSLLAAKQTRVHVSGDDVRMKGEAKMMDEELAKNKETRPIK